MFMVVSSDDLYGKNVKRVDSVYVKGYMLLTGVAKVRAVLTSNFMLITDEAARLVMHTNGVSLAVLVLVSPFFAIPRP